MIIVEFLKEVSDGRGVGLCQGLEFRNEVFAEDLNVVLVHFVKFVALFFSILDIYSEDLSRPFVPSLSKCHFNFFLLILNDLYSLDALATSS